MTDPIEEYLRDEGKIGVSRTFLLYRLYSSTLCSTTMCSTTKMYVICMIVNELINQLWHSLVHDHLIKASFLRKHSMLIDIYKNSGYQFSSEAMCRIRQLNKAIELRKLNTPLINMIKSIM